jgi:hypothetical protein
MLGMKELTERYAGFRIKGSCKDALGDIHTFDEFAEAREWWRLLNESVKTVPRDRLRDMSKTFEKHLKTMEQSATALQRLAEKKG